VLAIVAAALEFFSGGASSDNYMGNTGGKAFGQAATSVLQKAAPAAASGAAQSLSSLRCKSLRCFAVVEVAACG
jgi:hypothetical protein